MYVTNFTINVYIAYVHTYACLYLNSIVRLNVCTTLVTMTKETHRKAENLQIIFFTLKKYSMISRHF
jgi:hypothetical protein